VRKFAKVFVLLTSLSAAAAIFSGCSGGGPEAKDSTVAATVNGRSILLREVERGVTAQASGRQAQLSQLELAQARLQQSPLLGSRRAIGAAVQMLLGLQLPDQIQFAIDESV